MQFSLEGHYLRSVYKSWFIICLQLSLFFVRSSGIISVWTIVALTVDRFIAVVFPFKAKELLTVKRSLIVQAMIVLVSVGKHSTYFWIRGEQVIQGRNGQNTTINCG